MKAIRPPTVPAGTARIRISLTSRITMEANRSPRGSDRPGGEIVVASLLQQRGTCLADFSSQERTRALARPSCPLCLCAALDAIYWKPIQTGTREGTDRATVMRLANLPRERTRPESYRFAPPVSPHLAAQRAGERIELRRIKLPQISTQDNLIAEGAGGALVPINETQLTTDLMKHLKLPVLLVSRTSLGTINHTLLSWPPCEPRGSIYAA